MCLRKKSVKRANLSKIAKSLQKLPEAKKEEITLRDAVDELRETLKQALKKGYTYSDLAALLKKQGMEISPLTLSQYLTEVNGEARKHQSKNSSAQSETSEQVSEPSRSETNGKTESSQLSSETVKENHQKKKPSSQATGGMVDDYHPEDL
jgi:molybdenum cofactor biosynthesis enzyme MoaA